MEGEAGGWEGGRGASERGNEISQVRTEGRVGKRDGWMDGWMDGGVGGSKGGCAAWTEGGWMEDGRGVGGRQGLGTVTEAATV